MKTLNVLTLFLAAAALAFAADPATCNTATIPVCTAGAPAGDVQIKPQAVPTSSTAITTQDAYLKSFTVANTTAGALTFTLADRQASPIAHLSAVSVAANQTYVIVFPALEWVPNGFTVVASGAGLTMYGAFKQ